MANLPVKLSILGIIRQWIRYNEDYILLILIIIFLLWMLWKWLGKNDNYYE